MKITIDTDNLETLKYKTEDAPKWVKEELLNVGKPVIWMGI